MSLPVTEQMHRTELSLPIGPTISVEEARQVVDAINDFEIFDDEKTIGDI